MISHSQISAGQLWLNDIRRIDEYCVDDSIFIRELEFRPTVVIVAQQKNTCSNRFRDRNLIRFRQSMPKPWGHLIQNDCLTGFGFILSGHRPLPSFVALATNVLRFHAESASRIALCLFYSLRAVLSDRKTKRMSW